MPAGTRLHWGSAVDWAILLTAVLSALVLVLLLVSQVTYGRRQTEGSALWLNLLSVVIFPLVLVPFGNFGVLEYATQTRFCGSCHLPMTPYLDDLWNPRSTSLAALHFQHRTAVGTECYSCHTDYGLHGTVEAKLSGLRHLYTYVAGRYRAPLRIREPFQNALCLKCHDGAKRFMMQDVHLDGGRISRSLRNGRTPCLECHAPAHDVPTPRPATAPRGSG